MSQNKKIELSALLQTLILQSLSASHNCKVKRRKKNVRLRLFISKYHLIYKYQYERIHKINEEASFCLEKKKKKNTQNQFKRNHDKRKLRRMVIIHPIGPPQPSPTLKVKTQIQRPKALFRLRLGPPNLQ